VQGKTHSCCRLGELTSISQRCCRKRTSAAPGGMSALCRFCCKNRKSNDPENLAKGDFSESCNVAKRHHAATQVRGRFPEERRGPSRRHVQHASASLKIDVRHPKNTLQQNLPKADIARFIRLRYGRFIRTTSAAATAACASSVHGSDNRGAQWATSSLSKCWANDGKNRPACPRHCDRARRYTGLRLVRVLFG
jgi:hypothetical protein